MTASQLLYSLLSTAPAVTALVGEGVYPVIVPQGAPFPCLVYQLVTRTTSRLVDCAQPIVATLQVSTYAASYDDMEEVEQAALLALDGYEAGDYEVQHTGATDGYEEAMSLFSRTTDYRVTVPALPVS